MYFSRPDFFFSLLTKQIIILDNNNPSKYKMQFVTDSFIH